MQYSLGLENIYDNFALVYVQYLRHLLEMSANS